MVRLPNLWDNFFTVERSAKRAHEFGGGVSPKESVVGLQRARGWLDPVRSRVARNFRIWRVESAVRRIRALPVGDYPGRVFLDQIRCAWGNTGFSAPVIYLDGMLRSIDRRGLTVLECGSGLTSLIGAAMGEKLDARFWVLEHDPRWVDGMSEWVSRLKLRNLAVIHAPLRSYGTFDWYDVSGLDFPRRFDLVFCDGPPESSAGGRYGLLPVMGSKLESGTRVLLDDVQTEKGRSVLHRWISDFPGASTVRMDPSGRYARLTFASVPARVRTG